MIEVGIGPRQVNKFVTALGIPGILAKTLKKREREIQKPLADLATTSCHQAVQEEIEKTRYNVVAQNRHICNQLFVTFWKIFL